MSVFYKDEDGAIYHTHSTYGRGGEMFLPVYGWLDYQRAAAGHFRASAA